MASAWSRTAALCLLISAGALVHAQQIVPPDPAKLNPVLENDGVHAGSTARAALEVSLPAVPAGLHTNSNKPRDPNLIPLELTFDPPAGVAVAELVFPEPVDLKQAGADQPLSVFEHDFVIGVVFDVARDASPGDITVPATLRYQACDDRQCYFPVRLKTAWTLRVVGAAASIKPTNAGAFPRIAFGTGEKPAAANGESGPTGAEGDSANGIALLDKFTLAGSTGYSSTSEFVQFIRDAESGVQQKGLFEGRARSRSC